jgi:bacterioferritin-associated ferredoxin
MQENQMATVFIFGSDIEKLLKEGRQEIEIPSEARISAAARDLIKENQIKVNHISLKEETKDVDPPDEKSDSASAARENAGDPGRAGTESSVVELAQELNGEITEAEIEKIANRVLERFKQARGPEAPSAARQDVHGADDDDLVICRCEEITKGEIKEAIRNGMSTLNGIKRITRAGMGLCQGQTCQRLVTQILASELGISPAEIESTTARAPVRPVRLSVFATG